MPYIIVGLIIGAIICIPIISIGLQEREIVTNFIENYKQIRPGMTKTQVIYLLGDRYTHSYLKNGIEKLEWKYRHVGQTARVSKGYYVHSGQLTRKVSVKFQNDVVVEINALNMD
ncbi:MAG: outer membrane protein assembly factor BamE [Agathobacter sp.]|nr:outer membrane protein assembly factor BamE [Agathobacter sp.]